MSQCIDSSSVMMKRPYRKGNPLTPAEKQQASIARKKITHKEIKVFVRKPLKEHLVELCEEAGLTQAELIENLIEREVVRKGRSVMG
ncbi:MULTISPECIES: replication regulatory protein RepA [Yersinia pseudotuberculosis complex]|uniref:Protein CopB n=1 Tax=Yersinia pseudotuberculosis TaxID=633 RepID=A0A380SCZ2_YERPU|nr:MULTISPECIES: replication regulatory protein RepA [Yersinia pseudotuberculosis complex]MBO1552113.1 replication regulatory protein RepA [Yersinia pseudotuberculosis]MBO1572287.1 replication regulatory protein RepA [Yersinia pseudotuberculosis]MBO1587177.1 replication regulatory protein RepA [Yersinia pseudotuberculosis]MBO1636725.1 replication regulatory protein RepA [Yersinia pseudotuberculosis]CND40758.1 replication protein [Yersinia pseudotuberculosis]